MEIKQNRNLASFKTVEPNSVDKNKSTLAGGSANTNTQLQSAKATEPTNNMSVSQISKRLMNGQILAAQEKVTLASGNQSLALLYRSAIDAIDAELDIAIGENTPTKSLGIEIDYSPNATADRIVKFATGYFGLHQQQNPDIAIDEQVNGFMDKITKAIDDGFSQAREILTGLKVLQGDIATGIEKTYEHILSGLAKFKQDMLPSGDDSTK